MKGIGSRVVVDVRPAIPRVSALAQPRGILDQLAPSIALLASLAALALGCVCLGSNWYDNYTAPVLVVLCVALQLLVAEIFQREQRWELKLLLLACLSFVGMLVLQPLPEYITGWQVHVVLHHSLLSAAILLGVGLPATCTSIYHVLGRTPSADDIAHYPLVLLPVATVVALYIFLIVHLLAKGLPNLRWQFISAPYQQIRVQVKMILDDWPSWVTQSVQSLGLRNQLLGTGLLMLLTLGISVVPGVGAGVFLSEYAEGRLGSLARFAITALRGISLMILALAATQLVAATYATPLAAIFVGHYFDSHAWRMMGGSYMTAALLISLLVIPLIARATEEGCRSLPPELREGSLALGASEETTLRRVIVPWALPNIVTSLLLGSAEAAGSVAVMMFIAGSGDYGVGPFMQVTTLAYTIYNVQMVDGVFRSAMAPFQFTAAVLLLAITMGLGVLALVAKHWLARLHRGR